MHPAQKTVDILTEKVLRHLKDAGLSVAYGDMNMARVHMIEAIALTKRIEYIMGSDVEGAIQIAKEITNSDIYKNLTKAPAAG